MSPIILSCYWTLRSADRSYEAEAIALTQRCLELGVAVDVSDQTKPALRYAAEQMRATPGLSWRNATLRYLPVFIEKRLLDLQRPVLFCSADAVLTTAPPMPPEHVEVGYADIDTEHYAVQAAPLFFRFSPMALGFLSTWGYLCRQLQTNQAEHLPLAMACRLYRDAPGVEPLGSALLECARRWT